MKRPLSDLSVAEFTAEARLETPGEGMASERTLRRMRLGIGSTPLAGGGLPLRMGTAVKLFVGV